MERVKKFLKDFKRKQDENQERGSKKTVLEELFNDLYNDRKRIYKMNFVRGILFGAGSALGGTVVLGLIVWLLSVFVNTPFIGDSFKDARQSIEQTE